LISAVTGRDSSQVTLVILTSSAVVRAKEAKRNKNFMINKTRGKKASTTILWETIEKLGKWKTPLNTGCEEICMFVLRG
jgi:hypothetical protein